MRAANEPLRVVLDTNILFSAIGFRGSVFPIWELAQERHFRLFASSFILEELRRNLVLKIRMEPRLADNWVDRVKSLAEIVEPDFRLTVVARNDADNRILECAVAARAHVLVTGNMKDLRPLGLFRGIEIISPREFLTRFFDQPND